MQLIYSAISKTKKSISTRFLEADNDVEKLRMQAYFSVCKKYENEIKAIQEWLPDWEPAFMLKK